MHLRDAYTFTFTLCPIFVRAMLPSALYLSPKLSSTSSAFMHRSTVPDKGTDDSTPASMAAVMSENEVPTNAATIAAVKFTHTRSTMRFQELRREVAALRLAALKTKPVESVTAAANATAGVCPYGHS